MKGYARALLFTLVLLTGCAPKPYSTERLPEKSSSTATDQPITKAAEVAEKTGSQPTPSTTAPASKPKKQATRITAWDISGAMAARNKQKAWTASFNWLQQGSDNYQMRLFGPIGSGTLMISRAAGITTFRDGSKKDASTNAEKLLLKQTGIALPVNNLYYWIRGLPAPGSVGNTQRDEASRLKTLHQAGYVVDFMNYTRIDDTDLPTQIRLTGKGVFIKVIVKKWRIK